jgi:cell division protein FtsI/penicillin-binding protein 2
MNKDNVNRKIRFIHTLLLGFFALGALFSIRWQVAEASKFVEYARSRAATFELKSYRGTIYSSDGSTLAYSEPSFDIYIYMNDLIIAETKGNQTRAELLEKFSITLNIPQNEISGKINEYFSEGISWIPIAKNVTYENYKKLKELTKNSDENSKLSGWDYILTSKRYYPEGSLAAHVVGLTNFTDEEYYGVGGVEEYYNGILNPQKGFLQSELDAIGQTITAALLPTIEPKNGSSVYLTLDKRVQQKAEAKLKEGVEKYKAKSGIVIIIDPKTGAIKALANYPDYNPNERKEGGEFGNAAINRPYEAGSIGKIITLASAVDLGVLTPETIVQPEGHRGCEEISKDLSPLCTWDKKPQGALQAWECFYKSDNICFYHISKRMQKQDFYNYLSGFGIGKASGVDLGVGDSYGILKKPEEWNLGDVAAYSYGHGYQVNAVQAIEYVGAIANHGVRMRPRIVDKVVDADGTTQEYKPVVVERVIKKETADVMDYMMGINYGKSLLTWEPGYDSISQYNIAVKSGTALVVENGAYSNNINASFVGYDVSEQRTFAMIVMLEKPQIPEGDLLAFYNVRPLWLEMFYEVKDLLGVPKK